MFNKQRTPPPSQKPPHKNQAKITTFVEMMKNLAASDFTYGKFAEIKEVSVDFADNDDNFKKILEEKLKANKNSANSKHPLSGKWIYPYGLAWIEFFEDNNIETTHKWFDGEVPYFNSPIKCVKKCAHNKPNYVNLPGTRVASSNADSDGDLDENMDEVSAAHDSNVRALAAEANSNLLEGSKVSGNSVITVTDKTALALATAGSSSSVNGGLTGNPTGGATIGTEMLSQADGGLTQNQKTLAEKSFDPNFDCSQLVNTVQNNFQNSQQQQQLLQNSQQQQMLQNQQFQQQFSNPNMNFNAMNFPNMNNNYNIPQMNPSQSISQVNPFNPNPVQFAFREKSSTEPVTKFSGKRPRPDKNSRHHGPEDEPIETVDLVTQLGSLLDDKLDKQSTKFDRKLDRHSASFDSKLDARFDNFNNVMKSEIEPLKIKMDNFESKMDSIATKAVTKVIDETVMPQITGIDNRVSEMRTEMDSFKESCSKASLDSNNPNFEMSETFKYSEHGRRRNAYLNAIREARKLAEIRVDLNDAHVVLKEEKLVPDHEKLKKFLGRGYSVKESWARKDGKALSIKIKLDIKEGEDPERVAHDIIKRRSKSGGLGLNFPTPHAYNCDSVFQEWKTEGHIEKYTQGTDGKTLLIVNSEKKLKIWPSCPIEITKLRPGSTEESKEAFRQELTKLADFVNFYTLNGQVIKRPEKDAARLAESKKRSEAKHTTQARGVPDGMSESSW